MFLNRYTLTRQFSFIFSRLKCKYRHNNQTKISLASGTVPLAISTLATARRHRYRPHTPTASVTTTMSRNMMCLADYDAVGFDVDHTLAKYHIPHLFRIVHKGLAEFLVQKKGYDKDLLEPFDMFKDFCTRGLVYDIKRGNFLKLAEDGMILRASHGSQMMENSDIESVYGKARHWEPADDLVKRVDNLGDGDFMIFDNCFDMIGAVIISRIVDLADKKSEKVENYKYLWDDVIAGYNEVYRYQAFAENVGGFFPEFKEDPGKFVVPCSDSIKQWLRKLKSQNKVLFIMTSSYIDFAKLTMESILGADWQELFDVCIIRARKPGFFTGNRPFLRMDGESEKEPIFELEKGKFYSNGNKKKLEEFLASETGKANPKILYVGDSCRSDIHPAKTFGKWDTIMILEEIEAEKNIINPIEKPRNDKVENKGCEEDKDDITPAKKKRKHSIKLPSAEEKEFLTSSLWGSFFTDKTCQSSDEEEKLMNTLWGYIVKKNADIAIPTLEHIADLPLDHKFEVFKRDEPRQWGFYPHPPAALTSPQT